MKRILASVLSLLVCYSSLGTSDLGCTFVNDTGSTAEGFPVWKLRWYDDGTFIGESSVYINGRAAGATWNVTQAFSDGSGTIVWEVYNGSAVVRTFTQVLGGPITRYETVPITATSSNWFCGKAIVKNLDIVSRVYAGYAGGVQREVRELAPGEPWEFSWCQSTYCVVEIKRLNSDGGPEETYSGTYATNTTATATTQNDFVDMGNQYQGGTTNILWGTNSPDLGSSAVYDAIGKFALQNHLDLNALLGQSNEVNVTLTNAVNVTVTNSTDLSGLTNLLSQIRNNATNNADGNAYSNSVSGSTSAGTNFGSGESYTSGQFDSSGAGAKLTTLISRAAPGDLPGTGDGGDWNMVFCGATINLNPLAQFPEVATASLYGFTAVTWLAFFMAAAKLFFNTVRLATSVQTGGVPNLQVEAATFGGNIAGLLVALAVPAIFVAAWCILLNFVLGLFLDTFVESIGWSAWAGSLGSKGWYLLTSFLPVSLMITLSVTLATLHLTISKVIWIAAGASRFLFGK